MERSNLAVNFVFGTHAKRLRLREREIAQALEVPICTISRILNYKRKLKFTEVILFCEAYNISMSQFEESVMKLQAEEKLLTQIEDLVRLKVVTRAVMKGIAVRQFAE